MWRLTLLSCLVTAALFLSLPSCNAEGWSTTTEVERLYDGLIAYSTDDYSVAFSLLRPLAEKDVPLAQLLVGRLLAKGYGTAQNCELAVRWLMRAAQSGNGEAAYDLASFSEQGHCLPRSASQALVWYKLAAASGHTGAPNAIGEIYLGSAGIEPDPKKAAYWFERGAVLFDASAYYHLGELYASGQGVPKDLVEAYKWFDLAAWLEIPDQIDEPTKGAVARDQIRENLMPAQVLEGQKRASEFLSQFIEPKDDLAKSQTATAPLPYHGN